MSDTKQELLRSAWLDGKTGALPAREQAKAWALREIWRSDGKDDYGMHGYTGSKVTKQGGGSPLKDAMRRFLVKADGGRPVGCFL